VEYLKKFVPSPKVVGGRGIREREQLFLEGVK